VDEKCVGLNFEDGLARTYFGQWIRTLLHWNQKYVTEDIDTEDEDNSSTAYWRQSSGSNLHRDIWNATIDRDGKFEGWDGDNRNFEEDDEGSEDGEDAKGLLLARVRMFILNMWTKRGRTTVLLRPYLRQS
jgi:hypothetical protein